MLFGVGCTPEGGEQEGDAEMAEISVSPTSFATDLEGGEQVIAVTSNAAWTVSCDQTDVTIEPLAGNGNGSVTITVPAAAQREFKVVFEAKKQTTIPALGTSTTTTAKAEVTVAQNAGGVNLDNYLFYEDCGEDVEKNENGYWPYVDAFEGWNPQGEAAANVSYGGNNASVRASGNAYQPTAEAVGISGQPYVFLNKVPSSAHFLIENIAVTGGTNYIFTYNAQCQDGYSGSPTFATVDGSLIHLELSYDGTTWANTNCTYTPNGGNGWYAVQVEFKTAATATKLYARFTYEAPASNGGGRFDDFKLVAGGNGAELDFTVTPPTEPELPEQPTSPLTLPYSETFASNQGYFTIENVVLPEALDYVWAYAAGYGMKGSAFANSTKYAAESWLVSPQISLVGTTAPVLTFSHAVNKLDAGTPADWFTLHIKEVGTETWNELAIPTHGTGTSWAFVDSGAIDLSAYIGKNVQIAFKYTSSAESAGTWEVKNVLVAEGGSSEPEQPADGSTVATIVFNQMGYTNSQNVDGQTITVDENISLVFAKGGASTAPAYYDASQGIRMYQNGSTLDVTAANGKTISSIVFEFDYNMWYLGCDSGELSEASSTRTWTGSAAAIKFTCIGTDKNSRAYIKSMKITYK